MKASRILILAVAFATPAPSLRGQPAVSSTAKWEAALTAREQRADLLLDELKALDARIEGRIEVIVGSLRRIGDSKDSRTKVARMKIQTIEGLKNSISYYQTKRAALQEELRKPTLRLTDEQKRKGVATFDSRIEKRVAQILAVQKSLPAHQDYEKHKATGNSDWRGTIYEDNEDHEQNRRVTGYTNSATTKIVKELGGSITRLEQQSRALKTRNAPAPEIARNDALLAERRKQLAISLSPTASKTKDIGKKEAANLDKALQTAIGELLEDFTTLFARYSAYLRELSDVNQARAALSSATPKTS